MPLTDSFDGVDDELVQAGNGDEHKSIDETDGCSKGNVIDESIAKKISILSITDNTILLTIINIIIPK